MQGFFRARSALPCEDSFDTPRPKRTGILISTSELAQPELPQVK